MINSRDLDDLHPEVREKAERFLWITNLYWRFLIMKKVFITCTYRDREYQAELYSRGRNEQGVIVDPKKIVTYAKPGTSRHNFEIDGRPASLAFDVAFRPDANPFDAETIPKGATWNGRWWLLGKLAAHVGLEWGGNWRRPDKPHFQYVPESVRRTERK